MSTDSRRERWRHVHARLDAARLAGGVVKKGQRPHVPTYRPGQVPLGGVFTPITWDETDPRLVRLRAFDPAFRPAAWPGHRERVLDLTMRTVDVSPRRDVEVMGTMHRFWCWASQRGYSTEPASLLSGDRIDEFIDETWTNDASRATHRTRLRKVAAAVFPPPAERRFYKHATAPAHTDDELARFLRGAEHLIEGHSGELATRQSLHRDVMAALALTFGAGVNGRVLHQVREGWLRVEDGEVWLDHPDRSLPTRIEREWALEITPRLTGDPDAHLLRPAGEGDRNQQLGKVMSRAKRHAPDLVGYDADRAARHWHRRVLLAARFDVLIGYAGYRTYTALPLDMIGSLPALDTDAALEVVRGWGL